MLNLSFRQKTIFAILAVFLVIALIFFLVWWQFSKGEKETDTPSDTLITDTVDEAAIPVREQVLKTEQPAGPFSEKVYVRQLAVMFVERFGTFSNQNENRHIEDALALATENMATWIRTQSVAGASDYEGVTTKVIAAEVTEFGVDSAKARVEAQKILETPDSQKTEYAMGTVLAVKKDGVWLVDGLYWDKE